MFDNIEAILAIFSTITIIIYLPISLLAMSIIKKKYEGKLKAHKLAVADMRERILDHQETDKKNLKVMKDQIKTIEQIKKELIKLNQNRGKK